MGRNEEFRNSALYHGTNHPFEIGDVVVPGTHGAYATIDAGVAKAYAEDKAMTEVSPVNEYRIPKVYTVEPLDYDEAGPDRYDTPGVTVSEKGFRVTGRVNVEDKD
jgi:hypothetical protein